MLFSGNHFMTLFFLCLKWFPSVCSTFSKLTTLLYSIRAILSSWYYIFFLIKSFLRQWCMSYLCTCKWRRKSINIYLTLSCIVWVHGICASLIAVFGVSFPGWRVAALFFIIICTKHVWEASKHGTLYKLKLSNYLKSQSILFSGHKYRHTLV